MHCVLAALAADLYLHMRDEEGVPPDRWADTVGSWATRP
jgi:hypothetical protein